METRCSVKLPIRRFAAILLCLVVVSAFGLPLAAHAQETGKTVRVGWYESPFNMMDSNGRRSGYAYEYQQKIAAYTGWEYEYVVGSWPELIQMLIDGEIDLMSDVSYTPARTEQMLFSNLPMGAEEYYIFVASDNEEIRQDDPGTLTGKRIGVNKGSVQAALYLEWAKQYGIEAELVELTEEESDSIAMLRAGELDAYLTLDANLGWKDSIPLFVVGSSDFFFAVNKARPDLLAELNVAMTRIQSENRYYSQQLSLKYTSSVGANLFLNIDELNWLSGHGVIRVGYEDNFLAFCATDGTGKLTGALKDYLDHASSCFKNAQIDFEPVAYASAGAAIEALSQGKVDCVFPSTLSISDGEALGLVMTPAIMSSDIYAVVRSSDRDSFSQKDQAIIAIKENDPNFDTVLLDYFPNWQAQAYPDIKACLKAVSDGKADCVLISNYQYNSLSSLCERFSLTPLATGKNTDFYFAVKKGNNSLYSVLTRTTNLVSSTTVNAALSYYSSEDNAITFIEFVRQNPALVIAVAIAVLALILIIVIQRRLIIAQRAAKESQSRVEDLNRQVFVDALTHVRNKGGFDSYMQQLQARIDQGEPPEVAIGMFDCDHLKLVNDRYGHDKGNLYLQASCKLICRIFRHSPVFRIGGDEFTVVFLGDDYKNRAALLRQFNEEQREISASAQNLWEQVSISSGVAVYDPEHDLSLQDLVRRADKLMYENKNTRKETRQDSL